MKQLETLIEARKAATEGDWTEAKRSGDEINPASIGTAIPVGREAIAMMPRYADNWEADAKFITVAENFAATHAPALLAKLKRYEEALKFYRDNWQGNSTGDHTVPGGFMSWQEPNDDLTADEGQRARDALEEKTDA